MVDFDDKNFSYSDEAEYQQESKLSIKEIILRHIRKISDLCCQEFTGGFWEKKPVKTQSGIMFSEVYHPDIREAYCNAVNFLIDVVYPLGDKVLKDELDLIENEGELEIKQKLKARRKNFKQINLMFERTNFWKSSDVSNE